MKPIRFALLALSIPLGLSARKRNPTYDAVVKGMVCRQQTSGAMDCEYRVGNSLRFVITGVGQLDAAVTFFKVDFTDDNYAGVVALHGCVVVKPVQLTSDTIAQFAFVSPRDGKAYRDWQSCHKATRPR